MLSGFILSYMCFKVHVDFVLYMVYETKISLCGWHKPLGWCGLCHDNCIGQSSQWNCFTAVSIDILCIVDAAGVCDAIGVFDIIYSRVTERVSTILITRSTWCKCLMLLMSVI